jgi:hypothetical protein
VHGCIGENGTIFVVPPYAGPSQRLEKLKNTVRVGALEYHIASEDEIV